MLPKCFPLRRHQRKIIAVLVCLAVPSCGIYEERRHLSMIGQTMDKAAVEMGGVAYHVEFIPLFSGPPSDLEVLIGDLVVIIDSGTPVVVVRRKDKAPLNADEFHIATNIAAKACLNNPEWNIGNSRAALAKYRPTFSPTPGALKGRGFLVKGQWHLYEACE